MSLCRNDDVFKFLEFYQSEEVIWNPKHKDHKDKSKVHDAWVRISDGMETPIPELKRKKEALMATFRQHLKKKKKSVISGCAEEDVYKPVWVFYNTMESFLGAVYECPSKLNNIARAAEASGSKDDASQDQHANCSNVVNMHEGFSPTLNRTALKRRLSTPPEFKKATKQMQDALRTINTVLTNKSSQNEDICDIYGRLVASKLKKYFSDIEQQEVMFELDELLANRIRLSLQKRSTSSLSTMTSPGSFDSASPRERYHPSSSHKFPDSPVQMPQRQFSSDTDPLFVLEQNNIFTQSMTLSSPEHEQLQQPTDQQKNRDQGLSDDDIDSQAIVKEEFLSNG